MPRWLTESHLTPTLICRRVGTTDKVEFEISNLAQVKEITIAAIVHHTSTGYTKIQTDSLRGCQGAVKSGIVVAVTVALALSGPVSVAWKVAKSSRH